MQHTCIVGFTKGMITRLSLAVLAVSQNQQRFIEEDLLSFGLVNIEFFEFLREFPWSQSKPVICAQSIMVVYYQNIHSCQPALTTALSRTRKNRALSCQTLRGGARGSVVVFCQSDENSIVIDFIDNAVLVGNAA